MDKKKMKELMKKRSPIAREAIKPVDFFNPNEDGQQTSEPVKQQESPEKVSKKSKQKALIKYTTYLPDELIVKIKMQAVLQRKKSYQIIIQALEEFFK